MVSTVILQLPWRLIMAKAWKSFSIRKSFSILIVLALVLSMGLMASVLCCPPGASAQSGWSMFFAETYEMNYSQWDSTTDNEIWVSIMYEDQTVKHVQLTDTSKYDRWPSIAVAPNGNIIVAWGHQTEVEPGNWQNQIYCSILNRSGTVVKADILLSSPSYGIDPCVAVTPNGKVFVVWEVYVLDNGNQPLSYAILDTAGNIVTPQTNIAGTYQMDDPTVATSTKDSSNNNVVIAWEEEDDSRYWQVWFTVLDSNENTLVANTQVTNTSRNSEEINSTILPDGNFAIVWEEEDESGDDQVWFTIRDGAGNTVKANTQLTISTDDSGDPAVAATPGGNIVIVWEEWVSEDDSVFYTILDSSGNVVKPIAQVNTSSEDNDDCDVAIDQNGNMVISWEQWIASDRVGFAILDPGGTIITTDLALTDGTYDIDLDGGEGRRNVATMPTTPDRPVGGGAYTPDKLAILAPWVALALAIVSGTTIVIRRSRAQG
jgi:hypothetical protein